MSAPSGILAAQKAANIHSYLAFLRGERIPASPLELFLEISNLCNLKCAMCPTFSGLNRNRFESLRESERGFLPLDELLGQLEPSLRQALNVHCFGYGEPTIHPRFSELLRRIAQYEVLIDFFTNGMHLSKPLCEALVELGVYQVTVSFSGVTAEEYENVYLGGSFERVLAGIELLAATKKAHHSHYPIIAVNSLAFEHHVQRFDAFVELMAARGVNLIYIKSLQAHDSISQLQGHASVYRPWVEGEILSRAQSAAERLGVALSVDQYTAQPVQSDEEWLAAKRQLVSGRELTTAADLQVFPIDRFADEARRLEPLRSKSQAPAPQADDFSKDDEASLRARFELGPRSDAGKFFCVEPFKTLYVRQDGTVKPCCFGSNEAPALGQLTQSTAGEIWDGKRYSLIRRGIVDKEYSHKLCGACLKHRMGPREHSSYSLIREFADWYRRRFRVDLPLEPVWLHDSLYRNDEVAVHVRTGAVPVSTMSEPSDGARRLAIRVDDRMLQAEPYDDLLAGYLDRQDGAVLYGWLWCPSEPTLRLHAAIYDGERLVGTVEGNNYRADLAAAAIGDGYYGFAFRLPSALFDGKPHYLTARLAGSAAPLRRDPLEVCFRAPNKR